MKKLRVGYYCLQNPENKRVWSGTHYSLMVAIENTDCEVVNLSPILYPKSYHRLLGLYHRIHQIFSKKLINEEFTFLSAIYSNLHFKKVIKQTPVDVLFCPAASAQMALLRTEIPIIFFNDSTFDQSKDYNINFKEFSKISLLEGYLLQKIALKKSQKVLFCSDWAGNFAKNFYNLSKDKVEFVKLGANMIVPESISKKDFSKKIVFLFSGLQWEKKGGNIVLETIKLLKIRGFDVLLNCIGGEPPVENDYIKYFGFLDKNIADDVELLKKLHVESHFLFVPSRADCYGIVFSEASAYGLINIATDTGGISSVVKEGQNGFLFPLEYSAKDFANFLEKIIVDIPTLENLSTKSRKRYDEVLSWKHFSYKFREILSEIYKKDKNGAKIN